MTMRDERERKKKNIIDRSAVSFWASRRPMVSLT